ncbi:Ulp1 protease family protein [Cordyceps fumosorosea ARSEF 2679]|uniref:Ulp1 protease family protein n=1 Tax=Cordyceps fumosorosea (strain ARSEF 2679) TaxID=1081104 RepID=A0A162MGD8_CORFA|nr:Ulp1 protease family protein [Cordyceps fumosorosea ARSEF 2679]OAA55730.1 Ulp1 protease family protein [Cordyceps fumosorosea ARSEF 2679]
MPLRKHIARLGGSRSKSDDDKPYLSYYDANLTFGDVKSLKNDWLPDSVITFWQEYLERETLPRYPQARICLLRPSMTFWLMHADPRETNGGLPNLTKVTHLFLPINDNRNVSDAEGGSHWSLLLVSVHDGIAFHYDSLGNANFDEGRLATRKLSEHLRRPLRFINLDDSPQQENGSDCGVFVCLLMRHLLVKRLLGATAREKVSMSMGGKMVDSHGGRKEMLRIIENLHKEAERRQSCYAETVTDSDDSRHSGGSLYSTIAFAGSVKELHLVTTPLSATLNSEASLASHDCVNGGRRPNNSKESLASHDSVKRGRRLNRSKESLASHDSFNRGRQPNNSKESLASYDSVSRSRQLNNSKESLVSHNFDTSHISKASSANASSSGVSGSNVPIPPSSPTHTRRHSPDSNSSRGRCLNYKRRSPRKHCRALRSGHGSYASSDTSSNASSKYSSRGRPQHRRFILPCEGGPATLCVSNTPCIRHSRRSPCEQRCPNLRRESSETPGIVDDRRNQEGCLRQPSKHGPQQPPKHGSGRRVSSKGGVNDKPRSEAHYSQRESALRKEAGERYSSRRGASYRDKCKSQDGESRPDESSSHPPHRKKRSPSRRAPEPSQELVQRPKSHSRNLTPRSPMPTQLRYPINGGRSSRLPRPPSGYEYVENPRVFVRMINGAEPHVLHMPSQLSSYSSSRGYGYEQSSEVFVRQLDAEPNVLHMPRPPLRPYGRQSYTRGYLYNTPYYYS